LKSSEDIQMKFYKSDDGAAKLLLPVSFEDWKKRAKQILGAGPFDYVSGAAGAGDTLRANLKAFQKYQIRPRICREVSKRDITINLFGKKFQFHFYLHLLA
jgi:lactate 2-monooxygenase